MEVKGMKEKENALDVRKLTIIYRLVNDFSTSQHFQIIALLSEGGKDFKSLVGELGLNANEDYETGWLQSNLKDLLLRDFIEFDDNGIWLSKSGNITYQIMKVISDNEEIGKLLSQLFSDD